MLEIVAIYSGLIAIIGIFIGVYVVSRFYAGYYLFAMAKAAKLQSNPGTYQRISYGFQLLWLSVFSLILL